MQTADCRLADYISCYLYEYILYIPIPIRSASLANRSSSLANPSASLQVCSLHLSHTVVYYNRKAIDQVLIALQFYASGGLLQVVGGTTGVDKSTILLVVHNADAILETIIIIITNNSNHRAYSPEISSWNTNCQLARQSTWFLHHVLTVNQKLTYLPSNGSLSNISKTSGSVSSGFQTREN